ncbi:putative bifunctional diguanylate cyclase/phosphodiesterase [Pantoea sp.]|uniref:putative bifunctional diguanylate cyclase/phosphodiesterase n=1 Tax=Pantoea sp. TaxID=69393 RepID=UPI0028A2B977|nr:EAL domain-containing protein [Pantoea sp.]
MMLVTWDHILVAVSLIVAFMAAFTALDTAGRVAVSRGWLANLWLTCGGTAMGIGIWAMHFIGMLAMNFPMSMRYDARLTVLSLLLAVVSAILAFTQVVGGSHLTLRRLIAGTVILGSGVVGMHFTGMAALLFSPAISWDPTLVAFSVLIAFSASGTALWLAFHLRQDQRGSLPRRLLAALTMGIAISGMHYVGMAAARFDAAGLMMHHGVSDEGLAVWVTLITLSILGLTLLASMLQLANQELRQLAMHDNLTSLPNRALLEQRLDKAIQRATLNNGAFALMFMDLDGFKAVNDTWGHHVGDRLLIEVAGKLSAPLSEGATLARLGGDEFVLLLPDGDAASAAALAQRLVALIDAPVELDRYRLRVSLSVGIALFPLHGESKQALMLNADSAMYHTKKNGRNGWSLFEPAMRVMTQHQLALANDLWQALERQEMRLFYQPKFLSSGNTLLGFEVLLRWQHPTRGLLTPDQFLSRAEKTGQIVALGNWVINEACAQLKAWQREGHTQWAISVNLSALQFHQRDLVETVRQTLARHQLSAASLTLEISETLAKRDPTFSQQLIGELHRLGVKVSIDNFGIGYANLLQLKHFDASELKIDRSFINKLRADSEDATVVSAMLTLARSLNLRMVAEGVETEEQQRLLTGLGFEVLQGYLLGKPTPAERISEFITRPMQRWRWQRT